MLEFETYCKTCDDLTEQIQKANYKIVYREIEVIGYKKGAPLPIPSYPFFPSCSTATSDSTSANEENALKSDLEYQRLVYARDELQSRLNFIRDHAEFPHKDAEVSG